MFNPEPPISGPTNTACGQAKCRRNFLLGLLMLAALLASTACAGESTPANPLTNLGQTSINLDNPQAVSGGLQIMLLLTVLSLAPAVLVMVTAFTRIIIVLSFVRSALAVPQLPPNQVLIGMALFLTFFVMAPTWNQINEQALQPYLNEEIDQKTAYERGVEPIRVFLFRQTRERDLALFVDLAKLPRPKAQADIPTYVLIPAFIISELKTAFQMGVIVFIPFLIIDMVVSSALMSMGMMMLPPSIISLPFKLLLFVMVDGWHLIVRSLMLSFGGG